MVPSCALGSNGTAHTCMQSVRIGTENCQNSGLVLCSRQTIGQRAKTCLAQTLGEKKPLKQTLGTFTHKANATTSCSAPGLLNVGKSLRGFRNSSWGREVRLHQLAGGLRKWCCAPALHPLKPGLRKPLTTLLTALAVTQSLALEGTVKVRRLKVTTSAWQEDAPYAIAIGIAIATTAAPLLFPVPWSMKAAVDEKKRFDEFNTMGSEDTKFTAMAVISFLPLFNWLAWVLAWLDSSDPRYALYAAVYLAPWVKSGLNITEGWLPLGAVALGAAHVQLERYVQSEGPVRSLPASTEQSTAPKAEKKLPGEAFDARGWADTAQEDKPLRKPLSEDEIRRREEKWELKRWDEEFAQKIEAEAVAEEAAQQKVEVLEKGESERR